MHSAGSRDLPVVGKKGRCADGVLGGDGFRCLAGAYYDDKTHKNAHAWRKEMETHPGLFTGWLYATWRNDYSEMENFRREVTPQK